MNNTTSTPLNRREIRWQLLSTVSAMALIASIYGTEQANAKGEDDRPTLWIELGGQAEAITGQGDPFAPHFITANTNSPAFDPLSPLKAQKPPQFSFGGDAKISFRPEGSDWIFSASLRYGRSGGHHNSHQQAPAPKFPTTSIIYRYFPPLFKTAFIHDYAQYRVQHNESHTILDFQAGKDVGMGMFGSESTSTLNAGVRIVRFDTRSAADIRARPDLATYGALPAKYWNEFHLNGESDRNFHGIGPAISWNGSAALGGTPADGELTVDWGVNAAVLFGRQRANIKHTTTDDVFKFNYNRYYPLPAYNHATPVPARARSVTVPNIGGFAGISYRFDNAALSIGYRADFFSGAVDGGIDTAKRTTLGFKGPFASVSIGVGD